MRGYVEINDLECSFYYDEELFILKLILPEDKIGKDMFFGFQNENFFDGIQYIEGTSINNESVRFYFDYVSTSNLEVDFKIPYYIKMDKLNNHNFGHHVNDKKQNLTITGEIIDALFSPKNAVKFDREETETNEEGYVTNIKHKISDLDYDDFEKKGNFKYKEHNCSFTFTVHKGFSTSDANYLQSYKSALIIEFDKEIIFDINLMVEFISKIKNILKFIFRLSDINIGKLSFRLRFDRAGFLRYGTFSYRKSNSKQSVNRRLSFLSVYSLLPELFVFFLKEQVYLNHISDSKSGYKYNDIPFLFSCFDSEFKYCFPDVNKQLEQSYNEDSDKLLVLIENNKNDFNQGEDSLIQSTINFVKNNELSFGKKILYSINSSDYLKSLFKDESKIFDYMKRIREFRNSLIHGREFKYKEAIDFKELIVFEKINYYLITRRFETDEIKIKEFISTVFFAFEHNLIK